MISLESLTELLQQKQSVTFDLKISPGASKTAWQKPASDGMLKLSVQAPPEHGKANAAVTAFLARYFGVSMGQVMILAGQTDKRKRIQITSNTKN